MTYLSTDSKEGEQPSRPRLLSENPVIPEPVFDSPTGQRASPANDLAAHPFYDPRTSTTRSWPYVYPGTTTYSSPHIVQGYQYDAPPLYTTPPPSVAYLAGPASVHRAGSAPPGVVYHPQLGAISASASPYVQSPYPPWLPVHNHTHPSTVTPTMSPVPDHYSQSPKSPKST